MMQLLLAPMEGVINGRMRALLTQLGGIDRCVTEFVRVTNQLLPERVFLRLCPELSHNGLTPSGTPVYIQLLGSRPEAMAANARRAAELGAPGIDLNFGCPAKTVNRHRGGSVLLQEPRLLHDIVRSVRQATPPALPVTAKIRLGYQDDSRLSDIFDAIKTAGADELVIHARTKADGYQPPAHWHKLGPFSTVPDLPVVANGEIWQPADYLACRQASGCRNIMLGRGVLASPGLPRQIKALERGEAIPPLPWADVLLLLEKFLEHLVVSCPPRHVGGPLKQWLAYLRRQYPEAGQLFTVIKRLSDIAALQDALADHKASQKLGEAA